MKENGMSKIDELNKKIADDEEKIEILEGSLKETISELSDL